MTNAFWQPFEEVIGSYNDLADIVDGVFTKWSRRTKVFAWRGQVRADWPLHSSLYRRLSWSMATPHLERDLHEEEHRILADVHRWGLHSSSSTGRLSVLNQLAALQHYGAPTRLIDITFNPWIGAWFAVEEKWDNGIRLYEETDARLFAIDVTGRLINENSTYREWEDALSRPWPPPPDVYASPEQKKQYSLWCTDVLAWKPAHFDGRIAAQNGGFLVGGVPVTQGPDGPCRWPKGVRGEYWTIAEVRNATSVSLRPHKFRADHGDVSHDAVYTFRITAAAKKDIRARLERNFGYKHATIYPDFTGFASFATPHLKSRP